jgi:hypothetical protein
MSNSEKLISIHGDINTQINYNKGIMNNLMIELGELREINTNLIHELIINQKAITKKTNEIEHLWHGLGVSKEVMYREEVKQ